MKQDDDLSDALHDHLRVFEDDLRQGKASVGATLRLAVLAFVALGVLIGGVIYIVASGPF